MPTIVNRKVVDKFCLRLSHRVVVRAWSLMCHLWLATETSIVKSNYVGAVTKALV